MERLQRRSLKIYARSLYSVIKQLKLKGVITALLSDSEFSQLIKPLGTRPLILSAHPGDEIMAIGGTMARYGKLGVPMKVLTFTQGLCGTNTGEASQKLGPKRKKELLAAYNHLGGTIEPLLWDKEEGFQVDEELIFSLIEIIDDLNPDIIYTPSLLDNHPDNQSISHALVSVLHRLPSPRVKSLSVAQYELWTPLAPNKILNIDDEALSKQNAIECHESQLLCRDYKEAMMGLNRYRAAILGAGSSAEAYYICSAKQYCAFAPTIAVPVIQMKAMSEAQLKK